MADASQVATGDVLKSQGFEGFVGADKLRGYKQKFSSCLNCCGKKVFLSFQCLFAKVCRDCTNFGNSCCCSSHRSPSCCSGSGRTETSYLREKLISPEVSLCWYTFCFCPIKHSLFHLCHSLSGQHREYCTMNNNHNHTVYQLKCTSLPYWQIRVTSNDLVSVCFRPTKPLGNRTAARGFDLTKDRES